MAPPPEENLRRPLTRGKTTSSATSAAAPALGISLLYQADHQYCGDQCRHRPNT
jgi:hypothetical protein